MLWAGLALAMVARPGAAAGLAVPPATPGPGVAFATFPIPLHVESVRQGLFITLIQEAAQLARLPHPHIEVMSPMRAVRSLQLGTHDALFPALDVYFESAQAIVRTRESIDCKEDFVFTRKGTPLLRSVADLRGRRVGITRGYPYAREVTHSPAFEREEAPSDELNIRKLVAGRIDAFVVDAKTGLKAAEALDRVTLYRLIDRLTQVGLLLCRVDGKRVRRYQAMPASVQAAPHFECQSCHRDSPLAGALKANANDLERAAQTALEALKALGYQDVSMDFAVRGVPASLIAASTPAFTMFFVAAPPGHATTRKSDSAASPSRSGTKAPREPATASRARVSTVRRVMPSSAEATSGSISARARINSSGPSSFCRVVPTSTLSGLRA